MSRFEYTRIVLDSVRAYDEAERLLSLGWKVIQSGLFSVLLESPKGKRK
jgi:hypothetical protein